MNLIQGKVSALVLPWRKATWIGDKPEQLWRGHPRVRPASQMAAAEVY